MTSRNPSLYQINTRVLLAGLSRTLGRHATLDDIPDSELDRLAALGFDWLWFLGVWLTGPAGRAVSLANPAWRRGFQELLPDFREEDVCGSCFAVAAYTVHPDFGGNPALQNLRHRMHARGMRLLLDFVPNHTALDHPWVRRHPEFYIHGTEEQLRREPGNYTRLDGDRILAFGRDPNYEGWPDTLQLNYAEASLQDAMSAELEIIAALCDGVRCDMAMLILPDVFQRTWGLRPQPFWPEAIRRARAIKPEFLLMAEVYWDLEWELQQQGFDYTYDKRLYDRLRQGHAGPVRGHFRATMDFQQRSARFLENHDEPRAASVFSPPVHQASAVLTFLCPGMRFFHQGQLEGFTKRIPVHLCRGPEEPTEPELSRFYERLLACLRREEPRLGEWQLLESSEAWDGNWTHDSIICFAWHGPAQTSLIVPVNFAPHQSQCYVRIPLPETSGSAVRFRDLMSPAVYDRCGQEVFSPGLYLDLPPWAYHVFELARP